MRKLNWLLVDHGSMGYVLAISPWMEPFPGPPGVEMVRMCQWTWRLLTQSHVTLIGECDRSGSPCRPVVMEFSRSGEHWTGLAQLMTCCHSEDPAFLMLNRDSFEDSWQNPKKWNSDAGSLSRGSPSTPARCSTPRSLPVHQLPQVLDHGRLAGSSTSTSSVPSAGSGGPLSI
jgi:hypothetical protein